MSNPRLRVPPNKALERTAGSHPLAAAPHRRRYPYQDIDRFARGNSARSLATNDYGVAKGGRPLLYDAVDSSRLRSAMWRCFMNHALRAIIVSILALLVAPAAAKAQETSKIPRIGVLIHHPSDSHYAHALREGLRELGHVEGRNIAIEWRWDREQGRSEVYFGLAAELVRLKPDVIVAGGNQAIAAAQRSTGTIPIVMVFASDPVGVGFVASLARPGRNITGLTTQATEVQAKRPQLLKETVPNLSRVAVLWDPNDPGRQDLAREAGVGIQAVGMEPYLFEVRDPNSLDRAFAAMNRESVGAFLVVPSAVIFAHRARIFELAVKSRLPTMCQLRWFVEAGCLMSYGPNFIDLHRRAAYFVDKILKGAKPGHLPVEQPTKFELVINLRIAKALGVAIPQSLLLRADDLIQ
jgi:putative ABC transport system substrate-binding protein